MKPFHRFLILALFAMNAVHAAPGQVRLYIGTYTNDGRSRGIYTLTLDSASGALSKPAVAAELRNPSFLALDPVKPVVYATCDVPGADGAPVGALAALAMDPASGSLRLLNQRAISGKSAPCHVNVTPDGRVVVATQYNEALVSSFPVLADGSLGALGSLIHHEGKTGPNPQRQEAAHAHSFTISPDGRFAFACDLGLDRIKAYRIDAAKGALVPAPELDAATLPGVGPRHAKFSADARFFYVLAEMGGCVEVFSYDAAKGALSRIQSISTLPDDFTGFNGSAEIRISPDGRFVYASNRGPDTLTVFSRDAQTGRLAVVQRVACGGKHPRNFALSPDGAWLVCANRDTNNLAVFRVDRATGQLSPVSQDTEVPMAVCVLFVP